MARAVILRLDERGVEVEIDRWDNPRNRRAVEEEEEEKNDSS